MNLNYTLLSLTSAHLSKSPLFSGLSKLTTKNFHFNKMFSPIYFQTHSLNVMKSTFKHSLSNVIYYDNQDLTGIIESTFTYVNQNGNLTLNEVYFSYINSLSNGGALHVYYRYLEESDTLYGVVSFNRVEFLMCTCDGYGGSADIYCKSADLLYTCAYRSRAVSHAAFGRIECWTLLNINDITLARNTGASSDAYGNLIFAAPEMYITRYNCSRCQTNYATVLYKIQNTETYANIEFEYISAFENIGRSQIQIQVEVNVGLDFLYFFYNQGNSIAGLNIDTPRTMRIRNSYFRGNQGSIFRINEECRFTLSDCHIDVPPSQSFEMDFADNFNQVVEEPTEQVQEYGICVPLSDDTNAHSPEVIKAFEICISIFCVSAALCIGVIVFREIRLRKRYHYD